MISKNFIYTSMLPTRTPKKKIVEITDLPEKVILLIFYKLPLADRKNVRATCPFWYHCCNDIKILQKEKFVFRVGDEPLSDIDEFLIDCKYMRSYLELQGLDVSKLTPRMWSKRGPQITRLYMHECRLNMNVLSNIIKCCNNLEELYIETRHFSAVILHAINQTTKDFLAKNIVRPKLVSLKLNLENREQYVGTRSDFERIFKVFPEIIDFGYERITYENSITLTQFTNIKMLTVTTNHNYDDYSWMKPFCSTKEIKLELLDCRINCSLTANQQLLFDLLSNQNKLKILRLKLYQEESDIWLKSFLCHILDNCTQLRQLELNTQHEIHLDFEEFTYMWDMILNLDRLKLSFRVESTPIKATEKPINLKFPYNRSLNVLEWNSNFTHKMIARIIVDHCTNLQHFILEKATDSVLQKLFQIKQRMQTLIILDASKCTANGFTGQKSQTLFNLSQERYSINDLKEIEHLEIYGLTKIHLQEVVCNLQLPYLKYLKLRLISQNKSSMTNLKYSVCRLFQKNNLCSALKSMQVPSLEILIVDAKPLIIDDMIEFCKLSKRLRMLFFLCHQTDKKMYEDIFEASKSLRFIGSYSDFFSMVECYHRKISGEIRNLCYDMLKFPKSIFPDTDFIF